MRWALLAAVAAIGLSGASQPSPTAEQPSPDRAAIGQVRHAQTKEAEEPKPKAPPQPTAPQDQPEGGEKAGGRKDKVEQGWWERASEDPGDAFNGVIALVTIILAGIGLYQAWLSRQSGRMQLRAYLTVEPKGIEDHGAKGMRAVSVVINSGQTPAYAVSIATALRILPYPVPEDFNPRDEYEELLLTPTHNIVAPGRDIHSFASVDKPMSPETQKAVRDETQCLMIYGFISYRDVFGRTRITGYAHHYRGKELNADAAKFHRVGNHAT
jgi:hypothetical protein